MPGERRINVSDSPRAARRSAGIDACVMRAGWQMSDFTPPRLSPSVKNRLFETNLVTSSIDAIELERHHAAEAGHLFPGDIVTGMLRQSRVIHAPDAGSRRQRRGDPSGILGVPLHAQLQRLQAAQRQPAIERRRHRANRVLKKLDRLEDRGIARQRGALDQIRMPGEVLGHAVDDDVGAERERLLAHRRRKGVVDDDERALLVGDGGNRLDVRHDQARIGRRLEPDQPRSIADRGCATASRFAVSTGVIVRSRPAKTRFSNRNVPP